LFSLNYLAGNDVYTDVRELSKVNFLLPVEISTPGVQQRTEVTYDLSKNTAKMLGGSKVNRVPKSIRIGTSPWSDRFR